MKKVLISIFITTFFFTLSVTKKIKMYALYTPSHEILVEKYFKPSLTDPLIKLILIKEEEQTCETGKFMENGWTKTTIKKIQLVLRAIDENWGDFFIFSDVDIQFFGNFSIIVEKLMLDRDFLIQKDNPKGTLCSGFFVCRANKKTKKLFTDILRYMEKNEEISDQRTLNRHLSRNETSNKYNIIWDYLPTKYFFGGGTFTGVYWNEGTNLYIPKQPLMHHANWVAGIEGKIKQLEYVKRMIKGSQKKIESPASYSND